MWECCRLVVGGDNGIRTVDDIGDEQLRAEPWCELLASCASAARAPRLDGPAGRLIPISRQEAGGQAAHGPEAEVNAVWLRSPGSKNETESRKSDNVEQVTTCMATLHAGTAIRRRDSLRLASCDQPVSGHLNMMQNPRGKCLHAGMSCWPFACACAAKPPRA